MTLERLALARHAQAFLQSEVGVSVHHSLRGDRQVDGRLLLPSAAKCEAFDLIPPRGPHGGGRVVAPAFGRCHSNTVCSHRDGHSDGHIITIVGNDDDNYDQNGEEDERNHCQHHLDDLPAAILCRISLGAIHVHGWGGGHWAVPIIHVHCDSVNTSHAARWWRAPLCLVRQSNAIRITLGSAVLPAPLRPSEMAGAGRCVFYLCIFLSLSDK
mmetsp:Transcript_36360/g.61279  ORF Transcript_36360/g.61279 Transcript_36360/m.61279 type:complete len:213 (+) Transcript_36360:661-1299(+)